MSLVWRRPRRAPTRARRSPIDYVTPDAAFADGAKALSRTLPPQDWSQESDQSHDVTTPVFGLWSACRACRSPACSYTSARRSAARHFSLDLEELERQHQALADDVERGEQSLDAYLDRVVFHRHRLFSRDAFTSFMQAQSQPHPSVLTLIRHLASGGSYKLATINNESRELNRYRIDTFRLRDMFSAFFSSCYLRVRKPDARIYEIALDVMQAEPATSLFVDDREENVEAARALGIHTIHVTDLRGLAEQLRTAGVEVPASGPVSARMCTPHGAG